MEGFGSAGYVCFTKKKPKNFTNDDQQGWLKKAEKMNRNLNLKKKANKHNNFLKIVDSLECNYFSMFTTHL